MWKPSAPCAGGVALPGAFKSEISSVWSWGQRPLSSGKEQRRAWGGRSDFHTAAFASRKVIFGKNLDT